VGKAVGKLGPYYSRFHEESVAMPTVLDSGLRPDSFGHIVLGVAVDVTYYASVKPTEVLR
jgi:hypothetical protein